MQVSIPLIWLIILSFTISLPCGYLRENFNRMSFLWFLMIHLPIPFVIMVRIAEGISWHAIPFTIGGSIAGQIVGGRLNRQRKKHG